MTDENGNEHKTYTRSNDTGIRYNNILTSALGALIVIFITWAVSSSTNYVGKLDTLIDSSSIREEQITEVVRAAKEMKAEIAALRDTMVIRKDIEDMTKRIEVLEKARR